MEPNYTNLPPAPEVPEVIYKSNVLRNSLIGVGIFLLVATSAFIAYKKTDFKIKALSEPSCPASKTVLQACAYKLAAQDHPEIQLPPEIENLTKDIECPATKEDLESCMLGKIETGKPTSVNLQVKVNKKDLTESDQQVVMSDSVSLSWTSTNANFCFLKSDSVLPMRGDSIAGEGTYPIGNLKPGSRATFTIKCADAEDSISINVAHYKLTDFPKADNRWISRFDTSNIPTNAYKAFYFNSTNPTVVVKAETVPKVQISYAWSDGPGFNIKSEDFGGYWIGKVVVNETSLYTVTTAESWADVRVLINGYEVPKTEEKVVTLTLDPGSYQVEVEYLNNWHTTEFLMNMEKQKKIYSYDEARTAVLSTGNLYDVWYVNSYNENPVLQIPNRATRPTIIVLDSYEPLQWKIVNAKANNIAYVFYHSFTPGTTVTTDLESSHILPIQKDVFSNPNGYNASVQAEAQCWTDNYPPRCDNVTTILSLNDMAKSFANGALTGFTALSDSDENSAAVAIPRQSLTPATIQAIQAKNNQIKADAERQAKKESGNSVETLFDN